MPFLFELFGRTIVEYLCGIFGHPDLVQGWHSSDGMWYGALLEASHHLIVLIAVAISAIRDIINLWRGR
jgi:hypothetical protein